MLVTKEGRSSPFFVDLSSAILISCLGLLLCSLRDYSPFLTVLLKEGDWNHLGGECANVAIAVSEGRGFADPFGCGSGATAWVAPVYPLLMAALLSVSDCNFSFAVIVIVILKAISLAVCIAVVLTEARWLKLRICGYVIVLALYLLNFHSLFQVTHDVWIVNLAICVLWALGVSRKLATRTVTQGLVGGACVLVSPILAVPWLAIVLTNPAPRRFASLLVVLGTASIVAAPWVIRNGLVMGQLYPIKSNADFEMWQSLCLDDDGVLDSKTSAFHPFIDANAVRLRYKDLGEPAFLEKCRAEVSSTWRNDPMLAIARIRNRFLAATVSYQSHDLRDRKFRIGYALHRLLFPIPFLACCFLLFRPWCFKRRVGVSISIYFGVLLPYVCVSYYDRYAAYLVVTKAMMILHSMHSIFVSLGYQSTQDLQLKSELLEKNFGADQL